MRFFFVKIFSRVDNWIDILEKEFKFNLGKKTKQTRTGMRYNNNNNNNNNNKHCARIILYVKF